MDVNSGNCLDYTDGKKESKEEGKPFIKQRSQISFDEREWSLVELMQFNDKQLSIAHIRVCGPNEWTKQVFRKRKKWKRNRTQR